MKRYMCWNLIGLLLLSLLTAGCAASAATTASGQTAVTVRLGYFPNLTHAVGLVGVARGTFQTALGSGAVLEVKSFNAGPSVIEAMFAGELDLSYIGPNPAINGYVKSRGEALRILAGATSAGALFIVRPEAGIRAPEDLAGSKLATPQLGNTQDVALRSYLRAHGLETADKGGSVEIIPTQNPDILTLFKQGQIDGAWVPEPWATRLIQEAGGQVFLDERTLWPGGQFVTTHLIVSRKFLDERPDLVRAFLQAHVETVQFINANPAEARTIVNAEIERITTRALPQAVIDQAFANLTITYDPVASSLFKSAKDAFDLGFLGEAEPDLGGIYALESLNAVLSDKGLAPVAIP